MHGQTLQLTLHLCQTTQDTTDSDDYFPLTRNMQAPFAFLIGTRAQGNYVGGSGAMTQHCRDPGTHGRIDTPPPPPGLSHAASLGSHSRLCSRGRECIICMTILFLFPLNNTHAHAHTPQQTINPQGRQNYFSSLCRLHTTLV